MNKRSNRVFSNLNLTISAAQCPTGWDFIDGKCYQVIIKYHFRFNFVLWIAVILQLSASALSWNAAAADCAGLCLPGLCHLPRLYSQQQGSDLYNYSKKFHKEVINIYIYKLVWNIRFLNYVLFHFAALVLLTKETNG